MRINEDKLRRIVRESINEMLNSPWRDATASDDGRYYYQGTGSEESEDRALKLRFNNKYKENNPFDEHGGKSELDKRRSEYGKFKSVTQENRGDNYWNLFIITLRDNASRNYSVEPERLDSFMKDLHTQEGSASFIKYLYMNGFDPQSK